MDGFERKAGGEAEHSPIVCNNRTQQVNNDARGRAHHLSFLGGSSAEELVEEDGEDNVDDDDHHDQHVAHEKCGDLRFPQPTIVVSSRFNEAAAARKCRQAWRS
eukprot:1859503-Rhodomonas_salina.3